jgi:RND family efflux transporter MFP subunit
MTFMPAFRAAGASASLLLAALGASGCQDAPSQAAAPAADAARQTPPRPVRLVPAAEELADQRIGATGTLAADEQVVLGTKVAGRVAELPVDLGSPLKRGQVVARLDPTDAQLRVDQAVAALQQARARLGLSPDGTDDRVDVEQSALVKQARAVLDEAKLTRERMEKLLHQGLVAQAQLDAAISSLGVAEGKYQDSLEEVRNRQAVLLQRRSELELARQQLADTVITSPIDGAVSERRASIGEYLAAGAPVATIVKLHPLRLKLAVPERESATVRVGQSVFVTVDGVQGEHTGKVARISPAISEQSRTLLIEAEVPNERAALRPGAFAKADIVLSGAVRVITVPATSVVTFAGVEKVLTVDKNKAVERRIQTGRRRGDRIEIAAGLPAGTPVVAEPGNLTAGQPVTVQQ